MVNSTCPCRLTAPALCSTGKFIVENITLISAKCKNFFKLKAARLWQPYTLFSLSYGPINELTPSEGKSVTESLPWILKVSRWILSRDAEREKTSERIQKTKTFRRCWYLEKAPLKWMTYCWTSRCWLCKTVQWARPPPLLVAKTDCPWYTFQHDRWMQQMLVWTATSKYIQRPRKTSHNLRI